MTVLDAIGGEPVPLAAMRATSTIPIVFMMGSDPVETGVVKSFNRPGGNVTGVTLLTSMMELSGLACCMSSRRAPTSSGCSLIRISRRPCVSYQISRRRPAPLVGVS